MFTHRVTDKCSLTSEIRRVPISMVGKVESTLKVYGISILVLEI